MKRFNLIAALFLLMTLPVALTASAAAIFFNNVEYKLPGNQYGLDPVSNNPVRSAQFVLPGFQKSLYLDEQILTFSYYPDVKIQINAPSAESLDPQKKLYLVIFALPNGNTIDQTVGRKLNPGDDWHFDIQHIGAQTRFLREHVKDANIVTAYLESRQQAWPTWRSAYSNSSQIIKSLVDSLKNIFSQFDTRVVLNGHSGGGSFTFGYLNAVDSIPSYIDRIGFLDSDYAYDDASGHGNKLAAWLKASPKNYLCVIAYNDSVALYNGAPVVSATGGTWYRSKLMKKKLEESFSFTTQSTSDFLRFTALSGRVKFIMKENPARAILHTVQVELNGFIESIVSGTPLEEIDYVYYGPRAYTKWIQDAPIAAPASFGLKTEGNTGLRVVITPDSGLAGYYAYLSTDGTTFNDSVKLSLQSLVINNLKEDSLYFIKLKSFNSSLYSPFTELLAATTGNKNPEVLIVSAYDRKATHNRFNYIRQHASSFFKNKYNIISATNDAVINGRFKLSDYKLTDYQLGDESTVDETFNSAEQMLIKAYLSGGGKLFTSGSEIGWDLDAKGTVEDKSFFSNYLKMSFISDAPMNQPGGFYQAEPVANSIFSGLQTFTFDNGTHGTINVKYPDAIKAAAGAKGCLQFSGVDTSQGYAGVYYSGLFSNSTAAGKLVCLTIPIEAIYPDESRNELVKKVISFFEDATAVDGNPSGSSTLPLRFTLSQNYPNPFNPSTKIKFSIPAESIVSLKIYDLLGREVSTLINDIRKQGSYEIDFRAGDLSNGIYLYKLQAGSFSEVKKMCLLK